MPFLPEVILSLFANFAHVFTAPTWRYAQTLLIGSILCNGKRTVSSALRVMGLSHEKRFERYHRVGGNFSGALSIEKLTPIFYKLVKFLS